MKPMHFTKKLTVSSFILFSSLTSAYSAEEAAAPQKHTLNIKASKLKAAIDEFAKQSGVSVFYKEEDLAALEAKASIRR